VSKQTVVRCIEKMNPEKSKSKRETRGKTWMRMSGGRCKMGKLERERKHRQGKARQLVRTTRECVYALKTTIREIGRVYRGVCFFRIN
jgi:hypothetical protein